MSENKQKARSLLKQWLAEDEASMNEHGEDAIAEDKGPLVIDGEWGYACVENGAVFIPAVVATPDWPLRRVLAHLHQQSGLRRMIFSAVLDAESLKPHLRNIVREWDEYVEQFEDYSHCIEVRYESATKAGAVDPADEQVTEMTTREKELSEEVARLTAILDQVRALPVRMGILLNGIPERVILADQLDELTARLTEK